MTRLRIPDARIPDDPQEAYGMAFMIGYLGDIPDVMVDAYGIYDSFTPDFIDETLVRAWRNGYDAGVAFYSDHIGDYDD